MSIKNTLEQLGLNGKKADIYLACLELGSASVVDIAKKAKIKRTTCYDIMVDLLNDGLISRTLKGKKTLFVAEDPNKMQSALKNKERMLAEILPELQSIYNVKGIKPKIRYFEGKEGLKEVYADTLRHGGEIVGFASYDTATILGEEWSKDYLVRRVKAGISARGIFPGDELVIKNFVAHNKEHLRQSKLVSPKRYPFTVEINLYGKQRIALMSAKEEVALIIEGVEIHNTLKAIFDLIWDLLPEMKGN